MSIETVVAHWDCHSEKTETYRLLNMIHSMAGQMSCEKIGNWALKSTATYSDYAMTTWTNGIVDVKAVTNKDYDGVPTFHTYSMFEAKE